MVSWLKLLSDKLKDKLRDKLIDFLELDKDFNELNREVSLVHSKLVHYIDLYRINNDRCVYLEREFAHLQKEMWELARKLPQVDSTSKRV